MSRNALVLKGTNFAENKLATVELVIEEIPCTAISLGESSKTVTSDTPFTLTATVTPLDTTDDIEWSSSDSSVATVENGVVSIVGIGSTTITVTCGNQSATCDVTVNIAYLHAHDFYSVAISTSVDPHIVTTNSNSTRLLAYGTGTQASTYKAAGGEQPGIKIPANTAKVRISFTSTTYLYNNTDSLVVFAKDEWCGNNTFPSAIKPISSSDYYNAKTNLSKEFVVPEGADTLFFHTRTTTGAPTDYPDADDLATAMGLNIEFLTE